MTSNKSGFGPLWVAIGASLWATDTLFRLPIVNQLHPVWIVFAEHLIALSVFIPFIIVNKKNLFVLSKKEWLAAALIGIGGSATATVLFTMSFQYVNPSVSILLQKFQPILTVIFAALFLKEKPSRSFYFWAFVAFCAGVGISFPSFDFSFITKKQLLSSQGALYAFLAAALWSASTVAGKTLLKKTPASVATFWRFCFGLIALSFVIQLFNIPSQSEMLLQTETLRSLAYMSIVPGLIAVFLYYKGLEKTPATVATFVELIFPVVAITLNTFALDLPLNSFQLFCGVIILFAVTMISLPLKKSHSSK